MRELKFRAWDKEKKEIIYLGFNIRAHGSIFWTVGGKANKKANELEVMQYTGLNDKNRKEIYEGDILGREENEDFVFVVDFSYGKFSGVTKPGNWHRLDLYEAMNLERGAYVKIIGNIYENPNLLKEDK